LDISDILLALDRRREGSLMLPCRDSAFAVDAAAVVAAADDAAAVGSVMQRSCPPSVTPS
jgi:hypothetical protein